MSHLKERREKNCLNCNAEVYGKYCHICGQENLEPEESVWHLVSHFFNDITHFDGKFFSSLRLLIFKPGFLSSEYKAGRRNSYLNPVRMYVFTSFIFFLVFFSAVHPGDIFKDSENSSVMFSLAQMEEVKYANFKKEVASMNSVQLAGFTRSINEGKEMSAGRLITYLDSLRRANKKLVGGGPPLRALARLDSFSRQRLNEETNRMDSTAFAKFTKALNGESISRARFNKYIDSTGKIRVKIFGNKYRSREQFDSLDKAGALPDGWFRKKIYRKGYEINDKYANSGGALISNLTGILVHNFPQLLFISLPLFAFFLKLIYWRRKEFYLVSHGIYSIHLYVFYFIALLISIGINELVHLTAWQWPQYLAMLVFASVYFYEYKAMRYFYGQRRAKTIVKFLLALLGRFIIISILFILFLFLSILKV